MTKTIAESLASYVCDVPSEEIPSRVIDRAKTCFLDWLGVTLQGAQTTIARILLETLGDVGSG